jgi:hypothetical protein
MVPRFVWVVELVWAGGSDRMGKTKRGAMPRRHSGPVIQTRSIQALGLNVAKRGPEMRHKKRSSASSTVS